jgi:uncharacterized phage-associated protein
MAMASADAVADYILSKVASCEGSQISTRKLQMVAYYCQNHSIALYKEPLFDESVGTWIHGPAVWSLHWRFGGYGNSVIDTSDVRTDPLRELSVRDRAVIDEVWETCGALSESQLRNLNQQEALWRA